MADNLHDVVKLLLKRMESHPEEFGTGPTNRWGWMLNDVLSNCSEEEAAAIKEGLRPIRLQEIHETVMDELLNGDERRRAEKENILNTARNNMGASLRSAISPALQQIDAEMQIEQMKQYRNTYNQMTLTAVTQPSTLNVGGETITGDLIKKLKKVAGL